jgi:hypothetical protein
MKQLSPSSLLAKASAAYGQRFRRHPGLPKAVAAAGKVTTLGGRLCVLLPLTDGTLVGYAVVPSYRLVKLTRWQLAPYQRAEAVRARTPHERLKHLCSMVLDTLATVEHDADLAEAKRAAAANAANGANGAAHAFAPPAE